MGNSFIAFCVVTSITSSTEIPFTWAIYSAEMEMFLGSLVERYLPIMLNSKDSSMKSEQWASIGYFVLQWEFQAIVMYNAGVSEKLRGASF